MQPDTLNSQFEGEFNFEEICATAQHTQWKQDLFMLTSFDTTLPQRDFSEDATPGDLEELIGEGEASDLSKIRHETSDLKHRVVDFLLKVKGRKAPEPSIDSEGNFHTSEINEVSISLQSPDRLDLKVAGIADTIEKLSDQMMKKEMELARVAAENHALQRKLKRLSESLKRRKESRQVQFGEAIEVPSCSTCSMF